MRQDEAQSSERPSRGTTGASRATTSRGANGGLLILTIDDSTRSGVFSAAAPEERTQSSRRSGPRRTPPR